ncbi:MAG: hypothetical protein KGJ89_04360 [Patescibacteria group bacterium]|nr:hypothetical protein [Patescibacteria group bacterium]MDE2015355.1 hypothetical protein [Patescibacteria group bacterium]MDE2227160.1 hypothetical protein [Patescibacteria group bacterium]
MNKKVIAIFVITIAALAMLWAYAFGPLSGTITPKANPASLQPTATQTTVNNQNVAFNAYHNRDLAENFYTIKFPQTWQSQSSTQVGSYQFTFSNGSGSAGLQDVADNTTLELFVLSQDEPNFKKTVPGYSRINYQKISVNGNDAYQLTYHSTASGSDYETVKTYIAGVDHAAVITLAAKQSDFANMQPLFTSILNSFQWENK